MKLSSLPVLILFLLLLSLLGCRSASEPPSDVAFSEGKRLGDQQAKVMNQWAREFGQTFTQQNRAQFPANRDWLNSRAQKIIALMDESTRLGTEAVKKFEESSRLMTNQQHSKGVALIAASFKNDIEVEQLFKAQAQLPADQTITDAKTFNEKFAYLDGLIRQKQQEKEGQFEEGKRLMLTP